MNFSNNFIAFKVDEHHNKAEKYILYKLYAILFEDLKNGRINDKIALGSNLMNAWDEFEQNEYSYSSCIADYELTPHNKSIFNKQKTLSPKDKKALAKVPIGGVFTFKVEANIKMPKDKNKLHKYSIEDLSNNFKIEDIQMYEDQTVGANIYSLILDQKFRHYLEFLDKKHRKKYGVSLKNGKYEVFLHNLSPFAVALHNVCCSLVNEDARVSVDEINKYTGWPKKDIKQGLKELCTSGYVLIESYLNEYGKREYIYYFRNNLCLSDVEEE